ncbi:hypothetical protein H4R18_002106 [Coemansia javaensis]|uniref:Uncharacterized protein n=1 Tax=Coemansia javaensis TaxID=2761396 RepID=A0A9W8LI79_9FUNG|nr:hypothetical protein H4R18_002106 [Coemansia javaensis]
MSVGSGDEAAAKEEGAAKAEAPGERVKTRQDTNPERRQVLQRLMAAFRKGAFDEDQTDSEPEDKGAPAPRARAARGSITAGRQRKARSRPARQQAANDSDSDYVQNAEEEEDDDEDEVAADDDDDDDYTTGSAAADRLKKTEKRLILKFKKARRDRASGGGAGDGVRLDDIDWSEFDLETINQILERREALRKKRRKGATGAADGGEATTTAKLKRSSLAPPPLQLGRAAQAHARSAAGRGEGNDAEEPQAPMSVDASANGAESFRANDETMDVDGEGAGFGDLFGEAMPHVHGSQLHLPPRSQMVGDEGLALAQDGSVEAVAAAVAAIAGQPGFGAAHPEHIRRIMGVHMNTDRDMRLVLQNELQREETLFKDLRAEIMDKLFKLQTEERLLRMIVKKDFELPEEEHPEEAIALDTAYTGLNDAEMSALHGALGTLHAMAADEANGDESESEGSLSGMSSSSSAGSSDEAQDEEVTRGALSRVLGTYLPNAEAGGGRNGDVSGSVGDV